MQDELADIHYAAEGGSPEHNSVSGFELACHLFRTRRYKVVSPSDYVIRIRTANVQPACFDQRVGKREMKTKSNCASDGSVRLQLHSAIYRHDSFVLMLRYCANLKAIRYESTSLKRIVADKSRV